MSETTETLKPCPHANKKIIAKCLDCDSDTVLIADTAIEDALREKLEKAKEVIRFYARKDVREETDTWGSRMERECFLAEKAKARKFLKEIEGKK